MSRERKVLWSEGMFLTPHHFQQWDNYHEHTLSSRLKFLSPFDWGLTDLTINREGLPNGQFALTTCRGVLPGGMLIDVPGSDQPPPARTIEGHFAPSMLSLDVYLAAPLKQSSSANVRLDGKEGPRLTRYRSDVFNVADEVTGENEREIPIAQKNLRILFGDESLADYEHIKVAELKRTAHGLIALDQTYIPPSLHLSASQYLQESLLRLVEILHAKSTSLSEHRGQRTKGLAEFSTFDVANFWLLHTVNSFIPLLDHYYRVDRVHPQQLYTTLVQLAGELMTFSPVGHPRDLPKYNHANLSATFLKLDETIQELLKTVIPEGAVQIPLRKESESKFTGQIFDDQLLIASQLFLAASAEILESELIAEIQQQAKIGSIDEIEFLVRHALSGIALRHRPVPPAPLRVKLGYQYFRLETEGSPEMREHWDAIRRSRNVAIHIPRLANLRLELWSIKE